MRDARQAASDHRRWLLSDSGRVPQDVGMVVKLLSATLGLLMNDHV